MTVRRSSAQRRLRLALACTSAATGGTWGSVALAVAHDPRGLTVLAGQAGSGDLIAVLSLLAAPAIGALLGALPLDLLSHAVGRRPAVLASAVLVVLGALVGVVSTTWTQVVGAGVAGLGSGGYAVVAPKLAHELAERGHKRLMPRLAAALPAGAGLALLAGELGDLLGRDQTLVLGWLVPLLLSVGVILLAIGLPETPHWYVANGKVEAAHAALRRMTDPPEAAVAIDWGMMDAGMLGEQKPLSAGDLRVERVRRTVVVGAVLELIQGLPGALAAICLTPALLALGAGGRGPVWAVAGLACAWAVLALVSRWRRPERMLLAWVLAGTGLAACGLVLLAMLPRLSGTAAVWLLMVVATILVAAQYLCVAPACTGGTDPLVPPWLLRSQRRAEALSRPLVQAASVLTPTLMLGMGAPAAVVVGVCLALQVLCLLLVLLALPRLSAALR
ncbi:MAG: MFS transporter [Actinomyces urogenitalis]|nr:MFS transporter [Actinomyces urogenitalis]